MKKEYDFSKASRGKFHRPGITLRFPVYLEPEVQNFVQKIAEGRNTDVATVVNELLRSSMHLAEVMK
jgi:hypothetical protein